MLDIAVAGVGYVGLVVGSGFAELGHTVICADIDPTKIEGLQREIMPLYEPGLEDLVRRNTRLNRLSFTTNLSEAIERSSVLFVTVGTEGLADGRPNLAAVHDVAREVGAAIRRYTIVVLKSTVPVGTAAFVARIIRENQQRPVPFDVVSNPEFQRQGSAVQDFMHPSRIVIGSRSEHAINVVRQIYRPLDLGKIPFVTTSNETAELTKYVANAFLATKLSFINDIATLCERLGCDVVEVAGAVGLDSRIGPTFLRPGPGYGGSCLPKDTRALARLAEDHGLDMPLLRATLQVNENQPALIVEKIRHHLCSLRGRAVAVLGLSYKANTDDVRGSPSIDVCQLLLKEGVFLQAYDPAAAATARRVLTNDTVRFCADPYEAAREADCVLVLVDWDEFRKLDLQRLGSLVRGRLLIDTRNILDPGLAAKSGFVYEAKGRGGTLHGTEGKESC